MLTFADLQTFLAQNGLKIDTVRHGVAKYRDLELGCGLLKSYLDDLRRQLVARGWTATVETVTNSEHPDHGKFYLSIPSVWVD